MAGTIVVDNIQSDSSYASTINVQSKINFTGGIQVGGADVSMSGMRNRIINGDMRIAQRNVSSVGVGSNAYYTTDRWLNEFDSATVSATETQSTDAPPNFINSRKFTITSGGTLGTNGYVIPFEQRIEGYMLDDIGFGTASCKPMTISFWVKSNSTGTKTVDIKIDNIVSGPSSLILPYTINQADTWEYKTLSIKPNNSVVVSSWGNAKVMSIFFWMAAGSGYNSGSINSNWEVQVSANRAVGTSPSVPTGTYWALTGVQLEVGSKATDFERRPYGMELILCQRYYERIYGDSVNGGIYTAVMNGTTSVDGFVTWKVQKRSAPTVNGATGTGYVQGEIGSTSYTTNGFTAAYQPSTQGARVRAVSTTTQTNASAGSFILANSSMWIDASSEL